MITLKKLAEADKATKPVDADAEWRTAACYYYDQSRQLTRDSLFQLQLGIPHDARPLEVGLMPRIVEELAVIYDAPPARYLTRKGVRLPEDSTEHRALEALYQAMGLDLVLREADRLRALYRQVFVRIYASDALGRPVARLFPPQNVRRLVSSETPDLIDTDEAIALLLRGEPDKASAEWEVWERSGTEWAVSRRAHDDSILEPPVVVPYPLLPLQAFWDREPCGLPWLPPRQSRSAFLEKLNQTSAELSVMVQTQGHDQTVAVADDPGDVPQEGGPGTTWVLPKGTEVSALTKNPKISESIQVLETQLKLLVISESLPLGLFDDGRAVLTGAALRVHQGPLEDRRTAQAPLAVRDERMLWRRLRGLYNTHAAVWPGASALAEDTELDVELAEMNVPVEPDQHQAALARAIALGTRSVIDGIQTEHRCSRADAVRIYERVRQDLTAYPPPVRPDGTESGAPLTSTDVEPASVFPKGRLDQGGKPSVIQAVQSATETAVS